MQIDGPKQRSGKTRRDRSRRDLVSAFGRLLEDANWQPDRITVEAVTLEAGRSRATLYKHFPPPAWARLLLAQPAHLHRHVSAGARRAAATAIGDADGTDQSVTDARERLLSMVVDPRNDRVGDAINIGRWLMARSDDLQDQLLARQAITDNLWRAPWHGKDTEYLLEQISELEALADAVGAREVQYIALCRLYDMALDSKRGMDPYELRVCALQVLNDSTFSSRFAAISWANEIGRYAWIGADEWGHTEGLRSPTAVVSYMVDRLMSASQEAPNRELLWDAASTVAYDLGVLGADAHTALGTLVDAALDAGPEPLTDPTVTRDVAEQSIIVRYMLTLGHDDNELWADWVRKTGWVWTGPDDVTHPPGATDPFAPRGQEDPRPPPTPQENTDQARLAIAAVNFGRRGQVDPRPPPAPRTENGDQADLTTVAVDRLCAYLGAWDHALFRQLPHGPVDDADPAEVLAGFSDELADPWDLLDLVDALSDLMFTLQHLRAVQLSAARGDDHAPSRHNMPPLSVSREMNSFDGATSPLNALIAGSFRSEASNSPQPGMPHRLRH